MKKDNVSRSKEKILFKAFRLDSEWVGGLYYLRSVLFQLSENNWIRERYEFHVICTEKNANIFKDMDDIKVVIPKTKSKIIKKYYYLVYGLVNRIKYIYWGSNDLSTLGIQNIYWIPDFQHKHYPSFFSQKEIENRDKHFSNIAQRKIPLVLSSFDAKCDYEEFYNNKETSVYIMHFVSYIIPELKKTIPEQVENTLVKYHLEGYRYVSIMNQFWQHKNHILVFQALKQLFYLHPQTKLKFVFTGNSNDYRNPRYINEINTLLTDEIIIQHIVMLGFIDRTEQLAIMKNAEFVIQPSLFEGWGTVVEDAKVLDKTILLSDIPVHREQMNEKCILFDPHDSVALADLIYQESMKEHNDNVEKGIEDMYRRAKEYSSGFEQLLRDLETKK